MFLSGSADILVGFLLFELNRHQTRAQDDENCQDFPATTLK
jgi:hypothetical protein